MVKDSILFQEVNYLYDLYSKKCIDNTFKKKRRIKKQKLTVVFIAQYIPAWNKFEPIFAAMETDSRFNPLLLCVPMDLSDQEKKKPGIKENKVYNFFIGQGYEAINAISVDGRWRSLKDLNPDYIFQTRPYDYLLPEPYKAKCSKYYALNCNVMYGPNLARGFYDTVWNDSYFRNVFCYFSLDKDEMKEFNSFFSKENGRSEHWCFPFGGTGLADILSYKPMKKELGKFSKRVLWTPRWSTDSMIGGSNFFRYKSWFFEMAQAFPEVEFVVRPHPLMFDNFIHTGEMTESEVENFKSACMSAPNIRLDQSAEYAEMLWSTDIMVSDISGIMIEYAITKQPLVYCKSDIEWDIVPSAQRLLNANYIANCKEELFEVTKQLLEGMDEKKHLRNEVVDDLYGDISLHGKEILDCLWRLIYE